MLVLIVAPNAWAATFLPDVLAAERVTITIISCGHRPSSAKAQPYCRGNWQMPDGAIVTGAVNGADSDDLGREITGWGTPSGPATTSLLPWLLAPVIIGGVTVITLVVTAVVLIWYRFFSGRGRDARSVTAA